MVRNVGLAAPRAPVIVVRLERSIQRRVALIPIAQTPPAGALATTIIVGHHIITPVRRVVTSANPGYRRLRRARRASVLRATATAAQITVNGAVTPILATRRILRVMRLPDPGFRSTLLSTMGLRSGRHRTLRSLSPTPRHGQQRLRHRTH